MSAARRRRSYTDEELELVFLAKPTRVNAERLAALFNRTPEAIEFIWRWVEDTASFPPRAFNRIACQLESIRLRLGEHAKGSLATV